jgi:hypothetical protein
VQTYSGIPIGLLRERIRGDLICAHSLLPLTILFLFCCSGCASEEPTSEARLMEDSSGGRGGLSESEAGTVNPDRSAGDELEVDGTGRPAEEVVGAPSESCTPDPEMWPSIEPLFQEHCAQCHGDFPQFGAPFKLSALEDFTPDRAQEVALALSSGSMPPLGQPSVPSSMRSTLIEWLTCGSMIEGEQSRPAGGFESTRPILEAPNAPPQDGDFFELKADQFRLASDLKDHYECFTFEVPLGEARFIRRIETLVDDARVLHHIVLIPEDGGRAPGTHSTCLDDNPFKLVYGWAPGQGALHFEEGGIRLSPGQSLTLQIHYNNSAQYTDVSDSSGVRIYHGPPEGPEVAVLTLGPLEFEIPPRARGEAVGYCEMPENTRLIASFPHMHEAGATFQQELIRADQLETFAAGDTSASEDIITLSGWDFESQYIYESPMTLNRGDLVKTTCLIENQSDQPIRFGGRTSDEMCFNFAYISPPVGVSFCNQNDLPLTTFIPGECSPEEASMWAPPSLEIQFEERESAPMTSSEIMPEGLYWIDEARVVVDPQLASMYSIDLEQSQARARGAVRWSASDETPSGERASLLVDLNVEVRLVAAGLSFTRLIPISFEGSVTSTIEDTMQDVAPLLLTGTCGDLEEVNIWVERPSGSDSAELIFPLNFGPITLWIHAHIIPT